MLVRDIIIVASQRSFLGRIIDFTRASYQDEQARGYQGINRVGPFKTLLDGCYKGQTQDIQRYQLDEPVAVQNIINRWVQLKPSSIYSKYQDNA